MFILLKISPWYFNCNLYLFTKVNFDFRRTSVATITHITHVKRAIKTNTGVIMIVADNASGSHIEFPRTV